MEKSALQQQKIKPSQNSRNTVLHNQQKNSFIPPLNKINQASEKLSSPIKKQMENSFNADFSDVKIKTNSELASNLNAQAFTSNNSIHFAPSKYKPETSAGKELIGHELTHVLQQQKSPSSGSLQLKNNISAERQADSFGKLAANGKSIHGNIMAVNSNEDVQKKPDVGKITGDTGSYLAAVGIIQNYIDKYSKAYIDAEKLAYSSKLKALKAESFAKRAMKLAGSGKSRLRSLRASKAAKAANKAKAFAEANNLKAAKLMAKATKLRKLCIGLSKFLKKVPFTAIGAGLSFANKYYTTTNTTTAGKIFDSGAKAGIDTAFGVTHPLISAIDAVIGLIPGANRFTISNTMGDSTTAITGTIESIITGDITGLDKFADDLRKGKGTWIFEQAIHAGDYWAEEGGGYERAKMVGDFWGGPESVSGRTTAFFASIPGVGHAGEGIGWLGYQTYDKGGKAIDYTKEKLKEFDEAVMPEGRTLNPMVGINSILNGENPFW